MKQKRSETGKSMWMYMLILSLFFGICVGAYKDKEAVPAQAEGAEKKMIALTFDDGPHPIYTPKLLAGLEERGVVASFFVTGASALLYPEHIEAMQKAGHLIGNHTYHHVQLSQVGEEVFLQELSETNRVLEDILGESVEYVRPPFGDWNKGVEAKVDMLPVLWDIDPLDWCSENADKIVSRVLKAAEDQSIILMHDEYASSVEAALRIVDILQKEGYEFVTVDEILLK